MKHASAKNDLHRTKATEGSAKPEEVQMHHESLYQPLSLNLTLPAAIMTLKKSVTFKDVMAKL